MSCRNPDRAQPEGEYASRVVRGQCEYCQRHATSWLRGGDDDLSYAACALCHGLIRDYAPDNPWPRDVEHCRRQR